LIGDIVISTTGGFEAYQVFFSTLE
jgi:hypothetical protein